MSKKTPGSCNKDTLIRIDPASKRKRLDWSKIPKHLLPWLKLIPPLIQLASLLLPQVPDASAIQGKQPTHNEVTPLILKQSIAEKENCQNTQ